MHARIMGAHQPKDSKAGEGIARLCLCLCVCVFVFVFVFVFVVVCVCVCWSACMCFFLLTRRRCSHRTS